MVDMIAHEPPDGSGAIGLATGRAVSGQHTNRKQEDTVAWLPLCCDMNVHYIVI